MILWLTIGCATASLLGAMAYRRIWLRLRTDGATPTGYGAFVAGVLLITAWLSRAPIDILDITALIAAVTTFYWFDDAFGLPPLLRASLQFATGAIIALILLLPHLGWGYFLVAACLAAGIFNLGMTNIVNFYDGADLNLATMMMLTCLAGLAAGFVHPFLGAVALTVLAFVLPFAVINARPKSLYFGDAGSFAFACLLTTAAILSLREDDAIASFAVIPLILPTFDALFVLGLRVSRKENLLSRNYHHLYQRLQSRYVNFAYLAPQVFATLLIFAAARILLALGLPPLTATVVAALVITPVFYFGCRRLLLS
jgi:UDP-N-acetylmuramyl pentapeptide phosphotransferase/UDP-N-acetylglucosamine-1-phosphate transferase